MCRIVNAVKVRRALLEVNLIFSTEASTLATTLEGRPRVEREDPKNAISIAMAHAHTKIAALLSFDRSLIPQCNFIDYRKTRNYRFSHNYALNTRNKVKSTIT